MKKTSILFVIGLITITGLVGCAHSDNTEIIISQGEHIYGFWDGTWHGMISGFSFIGSLFDDSIKVYASNNNGSWYDFGFVGGFFLILRLVISLFSK